MPDTFVAASHEIWPEIREFERAMTTVVCAIVGPVMAGYLDGLQARLTELGITCPVEIMESSGGVMSAARAAQRPVLTVESGGAAGVIAAGIVGHAAGFDEVISFDMGGTTAKTGIVRGGVPAITHDFQVGGKGSFGGTRAGTGVPVKIPVVDLAEVGAGGGSIAWVDAGGALRVGPRSAGAAPGPACYGRGGTEPTVTDANLVLGYLDPAGLAGGVTLSVDLATRRDRDGRGTARPRRRGRRAAVHEIVNANMAAAIRVVTVQRGIDPRVVHARRLRWRGPDARGATRRDLRDPDDRRAVGRGRRVRRRAGQLRPRRRPRADARRRRASPRRRGRARGACSRSWRRGAEPRSAASEFVVTRAADLRARGQAHQLTVALPDGPFGADALEMLTARYHDAYRAAYGIDTDAPAQFVNARVRVVRLVDKLTRRPGPVSARDAADARAPVNARCTSRTPALRS